MEQNQRQSSQPWSIRQLGLYHYQSVVEDFDLFIVLNCTQDSEMEKRILDLSTCAAARKTLLEDPCRLHLLPFSAHLDDWRWHLRYIGQSFSQKVRAREFGQVLLKKRDLTFRRLIKL